MVGTGSKGNFRDSATKQHAKDHTVVVSDGLGTNQSRMPDGAMDLVGGSTQDGGGSFL